MSSRDQDLAPGPRIALAWDQFYAYCSGIIHECPGVRRLSVEDREDCAQEVMVEVVRRFSEGRSGSNLEDLAGWVRVVSRNKAADILRRRYRRPEVGFDDGAGAQVVSSRPADGEHDPSVRDADVSLVWEALLSLDEKVSPTSYLVFFLRTIEGWPVPEVAELFQMTAEQARARCHRVKLKFESILASAERRRDQPRLP